MRQDGQSAEARSAETGSRLFKLLRRWLAGADGMRSKHGASLALDILAANDVAEIAVRRADGRMVHVSTRDKVIAASVVRTGSFGRENMAALARLLAGSGLDPASLLLVNVGANIGTTCLNGYDAGFRGFLAIEPEPDNFRLLERNLAGLAGAEVRLVAAAVGETAGTARLFRHATNLGAHSLQPREAQPAGAATAIEVRVARLDELIGEPQPFVLVADVEGHEPQVLRGAADLLARHCRALMLEVTPERYAPADADDLCRRLAGLAPELVLIPGGERHPSRNLPRLMAERPRGHFDVALVPQASGGRQP